MSTSPRTSIIVPAFNHAPFLGATVRAILAQTAPDFEVIIVDDGSTDGTRELCRHYHDPRIRYIRHTRNKGIAHARNTGLTRARGRYIAYCNSDDIWDNDHLAFALRELERSPHLGLIGTRGRIRIRADRRRWRMLFGDRRAYPLRSSLHLEVGNTLGSPSTVVHRACCLKESGRFSPHPTLREHGCEDWDLWLRICSHTAHTLLPRTTATIQFHRQNKYYRTDHIPAVIHIYKKRFRYHLHHRRIESYLADHMLPIARQIAALRSYRDLLWFAERIRPIDRTCLFYPSLKGIYYLHAGHPRDACQSFGLAWKRRGSLPSSGTQTELLIAAFFVRSMILLGRTAPAEHLCRSSGLRERAPEAYWDLLADLKSREGKWEQVLAITRRRSSDVLDNLRAVYEARRGRYTQAGKRLARIVLRSPYFFPARRNLALIVTYCEKRRLRYPRQYAALLRHKTPPL